MCIITELCKKYVSKQPKLGCNALSFGEKYICTFTIEERSKQKPAGVRGKLSRCPDWLTLPPVFPNYTASQTRTSKYLYSQLCEPQLQNFKAAISSKR
jgi:hypothetical protein